ncbi:MAG: IS4 family transposase, partial [Planctomycetaceae bacterium]|nr:IS4 family transposase [Planctomycetaceae bacterium]
ENAVKSQIWIAISMYLIITILKKEHKLTQSLYQILQILSLIQFEKTPIFQALNEKIYKNNKTPNHKQLTLFNL